MRFNSVAKRFFPRFKAKYGLIWLFVFFAVFGFSQAARAGFGISPPYLKNQQLVPGSKYEQEIMLLRSSAEEELKATVKINAPEIAAWITIDKGAEFTLPKGEYQVPMLVTVNVPKDAELGNYKGNINIKIVPLDSQTGPGVAVALGARVDVDLTLTNVSYADFIVRVAAIRDFELLKWPWNLWIFSHFLHRVPVVLTIENIGNVKTAPSKVTLEVSNISKTKPLETLESDSIDQIDPFSTKEVTVYFPTKLDAGQYWGRVKVYKDNNIINSYEIAFTIAKPGGLGNAAPKLGLYPWLLLAAYLAITLIILAILIKIKIWRLGFRGLWALVLLVLKPFQPIFRTLARAGKIFQDGFWKWIGRKASRYNQDRDGQDH